jgi:hypothetical protein
MKCKIFAKVGNEKAMDLQQWIVVTKKSPGYCQDKIYSDAELLKVNPILQAVMLTTLAISFCRSTGCEHARYKRSESKTNK